MNGDKTIEQTTSKWGNRTLITVFASIVIGTNAFNAYIHQQEINTITIEYNKDRSDKKDERVLEQAANLILINNYERDIKGLEQNLKECKNEKN